MNSNTGMMLLLLGVVFAHNIALGTAQEEAALVETSIAVYKELIGNLKDGIQGLVITEQLTKVAKTLAALNIEMGKRQKEALNFIVQVHGTSVQAIDQSRYVVTRLRNTCDDLLFVLGDDTKDEEHIKFAIQGFVGEGKKTEADVKEAIEKLTKASNYALRVDGELLNLKNWAVLKKAEISSMSDEEIMKARGYAYGGAAACLATGPFAVFTCPIAFAIAASVTEVVNVEEIEEGFDKGIEQVDVVMKQIADIGSRTRELVNRVAASKDSMVVIQDSLDKALRSGAFALKKYEWFFDRFKTALTDLYNQCISYLDSNK